MTDPVLIDTGPFVACFNPDDREHAVCLEKFRLLKGSRLVTSLAIVTETLYLLDFSLMNQMKFLQFMASGLVEVEELETADFLTISNLMDKYRDCPMDFADATLVILSNRLSTQRILTLDHHDFNIYRTAKGGHFDRL